MTTNEIKKLLEKYQEKRSLELHTIFASSYDSGFDDCKDLLLPLVEALESISSQHRPRHDEEKYWLAISHESCVETLVTDTKLARQALNTLAQKLGGK